MGTIPLVNTSIIGKRAKSVDENRKLGDEVKRCIRIWRAIFSTINRKDIDIVHMNVNCSPFGTMRDLISSIILKVIKRVPFIIHCHCNIEDQIGSNKIANWALKQMFCLANRVIVLNNSSYEYANKIVNNKITIVPNFITMDQYKSDKIINKDIKSIVYVGHVRKTKGIDELLTAAKMFPKIKFYIVGPITDDYSREEIVSNSIGNIYLTGNVSTDEVNAFLDEADVFLFPSYTEGFSRALVEAMARGIPCIATDVGSNKEMLEDSGGIIIKSKDAKSVVDAIKTISSFELRVKMSKWNYEKAYDCYSIDNAVNALFDIYGEVVNEGNK